MSNFSKITKRVLAGALAALLVLTSAPSDVFAGEIDLIDSSIESVVEEQDVEVVAEEGEALELNAASEDEALAEEEVVDEEDTASLMMNLYPITVIPSPEGTELIAGGGTAKPNMAEYLQKDIRVTNGDDGNVYLSGSLKYVADYTAFDANLTDAHFVSFRASSSAEKLYMKAINGLRPDNDYRNLEWGDDIAADEDNVVILRTPDEIKSKAIMLTAVEDGKVVAQTLVRFDNLVLEEVEITVKAAAPGENILGKTVSDLQDNIEIVTGDDGIEYVEGDLSYVTGYTGYDPSTPKIQEGHYLALSFDTTASKLYSKPIGSIRPDNDYISEYGDLVTGSDVFRMHDGTAVGKGYVLTATDAAGNPLATKTVKFDKLTLENPISVAAAGSSESILGKTVSDLQKDIEIVTGDDGVEYVEGDLSYVTGYTGYDPSTPKIQEGHYLALHFDTKSTKLYAKPIGSIRPDNDYISEYGDPVKGIDDVFRMHDGTAVGKGYVLTATDAEDNVVATKTVKFDNLTLEDPISVTPVGSSTTVYGKEAGELQRNIELVEGNDGTLYAYGRLNYVTGFTGYDPGTPEIQEGNYIALHFDSKATNLYAKPIGSIRPDNDYISEYGDLVKGIDDVFRMHGGTAKEKGYVLTATDAEGNVVATKTVKLDNLVLEAAPAFVDVQVTSKVKGYDVLGMLEITDSLETYNMLATLSVNGVKVYPTFEKTADNILVARYAIKDGANYTLSVDTSIMPNMSGFDFIDYAIRTWDATKGEYVYGKPVSIKNNKFSYKGTAYAGKPSLVNIGTCDPALVMTAKDMTVKQIAKSIYTGQELILANVKYGKGILPEEPTVTCDKLENDEFETNYNYSTGDLNLIINNSFTNLGKVKFTITAPGYGAYQPISKTLTVNVLDSIISMEVDGPGRIYKADGKAANASYKVYYFDVDYEAPATKKATYKIVDANTMKEVPGITVKNGKVSIAKNYLIQSATGTDYFQLVVKAADWEGNDVSETFSIAVTSEKPDYAELMFVRNDYANYKFYRIKDNTITIDEVNSGAYGFVVRPSDVPVKDIYEARELIMDCTFKASNSAVKLNGPQIYEATKDVKNFTVTATATDGSKVSVKSGKYNIVYSDRVGLKLWNDYASKYCDDQKVNYVVASFGLDTVDLCVEGVDKNGECVLPSNFSVSVKNGTKLKTGYEDWLVLTIKDLKKPMIVTLTDKQTKEKKVYTFETYFAPEVLTKPSLTAGLVNEQTLTFDVKAPKEFTDPEFDDINFVKFGLKEESKNKNLINLLNTLDGIDWSDIKITPADTEGVVNVKIDLHDANLVKGKYNLFMYLEFGDGGETGIAPITIEVKAAPKVNFKPNKNGETITMNRFGKGTIDVSKAKNLDRVEIMNARGVIVNGEPNAFTTFFKVGDDGNIWLTEDGCKASLATLNANNRGYIEYKAYNGSSYATGYTFVSINVNGPAFGVDSLTDTKYGVDPSNYQNFYIEYRTDLDKYVAVGNLKKYTGNGWTEGTWPEEQKKGFYIGLSFGEECWTDGDKVEVAKVVRGTEEADIKWIELDKVEDNFIVAHLDPSVDYEGIVCKVSKAGKEVGRFVIDLDQLVAE